MIISPDIQNEILEIMSHAVLRTITDNIKKNNYFSIIMHETADISGKEQVSICFRHVSASDFSVNEDFAGFYETDNTSAEALFLILDDALKRFQLSFENCRGQCYDGASNVAGKFSGVQERVKQRQPSAEFVHCSVLTV